MKNKCKYKFGMSYLLVAMITVLLFSATAYATDSWETESNDSKAQANRIETNVTYGGNLHDNYDEDFYRFYITESGTIQINFTHDFVASENEYWDVTLLDEDGNEITSDSVAGDKMDVMLTKIGLPAGTYYIQIAPGYWGRNGATYGVNAIFTSTTSWETECNDMKALADSILTNKKYSGNLKDNYDEDFYKFSIPQSGTVAVNFKHDFVASENEHWDVTLLNLEGEEITGDSVTGDITDTSLTTIGLPAGTYYIKVDPAYWGRSDENYSLNVVYTKSSVWETEENGIKATADKISTNKYYYGTIKDSYDNDFFKVSLTSKKAITLRFKHSKVASETELWKVTLLDETGNEIVSKDIAGDDTDVTFSKVGLSAGVYYVRVSDGHYNWNDARYSVNVIVPVTKAPEKTWIKLNGYNSIRFSWSKVSGADGYYVYMKKASASKWTSLGTTTKCYVTKKGLAKGLKYQFKVIPYKQLSDGKYKGLEKKSKSIYTLKKISKPSVVKSSSKYVKVKWKDISGESGYQVYKMKKVNGKYKKVSSFKTTKAYKKIKATKGKTYYYKVRAYKKVGDKTIYAPWSKVKSYKLK